MNCALRLGVARTSVVTLSLNDSLIEIHGVQDVLLLSL